MHDIQGSANEAELIDFTDLLKDIQYDDSDTEDSDSDENSDSVFQSEATSAGRTSATRRDPNDVRSDSLPSTDTNPYSLIVSISTASGSSQEQTTNAVEPSTSSGGSLMARSETLSVGQTRWSDLREPYYRPVSYNFLATSNNVLPTSVDFLASSTPVIRLDTMPRDSMLEQGTLPPPNEPNGALRLWSSAATMSGDNENWRNASERFDAANRRSTSEVLFINEFIERTFPITSATENSNGQQRGAMPHRAIFRNRPRLLRYVEEPNVGRGFIKEICFSSDGRLICSPFSFGVRLLAFDASCREMCDCVGGMPPSDCAVAAVQLREVIGLIAHGNVVVTTKFSPTHCLLVTGCLNGKVSFYQPVLE